MITVRSHKEIERYEVSCESEDALTSLKHTLINEYEMELKNEWVGQEDGKMLCFAVFEKETKDLLLGKDETI